MPKETGNKEKFSNCCSAKVIRRPVDTSQGNGTILPEWFDWCTDCGEKCTSYYVYTPTPTVEKLPYAQEDVELAKKLIENGKRLDSTVSEGWDYKEEFVNNYGQFFAFDGAEYSEALAFLEKILEQGRREGVEEVLEVIDSINREGTYFVREEVKEIIREALTTKHQDGDTSTPPEWFEGNLKR